jgi:hypothetical protein
MKSQYQVEKKSTIRELTLQRILKTGEKKKKSLENELISIFRRMKIIWQKWICFSQIINYTYSLEIEKNESIS